MRRRRIWVVAAVAVAAVGVVAALAALVAFVSAAPFETTLEFRIRDRVSTGAVWNATVTLQDRFLRTWYAGDGDTLVFSRLDPGEAKLEVSAPGYQSVSVPVTLRRGRNRLDEPIDVTGLQIPGLARFMVSEDLSGSDLYATFWPLGSEGPAVVNHPALDLWIGARISTQRPGPTRGETRFAGEIEWRWDQSPKALARYRARIPLEHIEDRGAAPLVIDYLVIVPDPLAIERDEVAAIVTAAWTDGEPASLPAYLARYADRFDFYVYTSWSLSRP
ncbi:MAG: carboxypeptidase-like regulatory domain-containing protein [Spirochaetaceae bacterium]|nr:carboxypeptidase-like regulatory domain-containing protein [Spirochaetaceae bacterium]